VLQEFDGLKTQVTYNDQINVMYNIVKEAVVGGLADYNQAKEQFGRAFKKMRFENRGL
jgi:hypothetical protein